jgi:hypothetical protein
MTELVKIKILSIYEKKGGGYHELPDRMAKLTPDAWESLQKVRDRIEAKGGQLLLSDGFRNYEMQLKAHLDWKEGRKSSYSPPPGAGMHQAGRAIDFATELKYLNPDYDKKDKSTIKVAYDDARAIFEEEGWSFIIPLGKRGSEEWHCEYRGEFAKYREAHGYKYMAQRAMADIGVLSEDEVDKSKVQPKFLQEQLKRAGYYGGAIDGIPGKMTKKAVRDAQDDAGLDITGEADTALMEYLERVIDNHENKDEDNGSGGEEFQRIYNNVFNLVGGSAVLNKSQQFALLDAVAQEIQGIKKPKWRNKENDN